MKPILSFLFSFFILASHASAAVLDKHRTVATDAILQAGNGIYSIFVEDDPASPNCGTWTARTAALHPAGPGKNVLYGQGTSNTILRSYTTDSYYATVPITTGAATTSPLCATPPLVTPILFGNATTGYRLTWSFQDGATGPSIDFVQEMVIVGPVDGSETIDNTVIRETHTVRNRGSGTFAFGLRKHWDWQIEGDDGPYFGSCDSPTVACDRSMNLTADGSRDGAYPSTYVINHDPVATGCPGSVTPVASGCTGQPLYLVAGTVAPPSSLFPPPTAPELLQFGRWRSLISSRWLPALQDAALCGARGSGSEDDTSVAYFYGLTPETAITIGTGEERSFTQYVAAAPDRCPAIVSVPPSDPCCPPWNSTKLEDMLFYSGSGGIGDPYTLKFQPFVSLHTQMQAYIDYLNAMNSAITAITIHFRVNDAGTGNTPTGGPQVGLDHWVTWSANGNAPSPNFFNIANELMQINRWYRIHTGIYLENGQRFFPDTCANNDVDVRIQVQPHALRPVIEFRKANGRTVEKPLRDVR